MDLSTVCLNCGHLEEEHSNKWDGMIMPFKSCFSEDSKLRQGDLCPCPGFDNVLENMEKP